jgi:hypothetical protein
MIKHKSLFMLFLISFTLLSACSSQKLVSAGSSNNPGSEPTRVVVRILNLDLALTALPTQTPVPPLVTPQPVIIQSPTPLQATASQDATTQLTPSCTNRAEFIKDLNIFDNAALEAGQVFAKVWRIKNTGTCVWTTDYVLAFYSGEQMSGQSSTPFPTTVQPDATVDLRINLIAPLNQASYNGNWVLKDASGNVFGVGEMGNQSISVTILVKPTPMPTAGCVACDRLRNP